MKCKDCCNCEEVGFSAEMGSMAVFQGVGGFYCTISGFKLEDLNMDCGIRCVKCNKPDARINGEDKVFCENCLKDIVDKPVEKLDLNELRWD